MNNMEHKFQFIYKSGLKLAYKTYTLEQIVSVPMAELCDLHNDWELIAIRQYTGLQDKNGKDSCGGDVIKDFNGVIYIIFFSQGGFRCRKPGWKECSYLPIHEIFDWEIIGHIHDGVDYE